MSADEKHHIDVGVETTFLPEQSDPDKAHYVFAYTVTIANTGTVAAKLLNRHWVITDAEGRVQEVRGAGVVGEQPHLAPGGRFRYTSGTLIGTPVGSMQGEYEMIADDGVRFLAPIPRFSLAIPRTLH